MHATMDSPVALPLRPPVRVNADKGLNSGYNIPLGSLRGFVTALVVAHHAVLAYHPWAPPPPASLLSQPPWWQAFPVADSSRWAGWAFFAGWNDVFFMALMFFLSGYFAWGSLQRKGSGGFTRGRLLRLGAPFVVAAGLLAPLAYYPAYLQTNAPHHSLFGFWQQWRALSSWPAGPAWFIWVLLAFDCAAAAIFKLAPRWAELAHGRSARVLRRPLACFVALVLFSGLAYVPMALIFGPLDWKTWGPFAFQSSRILLYAVYFTAGIVLAAGPAECTLLSPAGALAKRWIFWPVTAAIAFIAITTITIMAAINPAAQRSLSRLGNLAFPVSCAASCFALLSLYLRFAKSRGPLGVNYCAAAYGIYLVHYPVVNWLQYALLPWHPGALLKGIVVTTAALALSWGLVAVGRCSRTLARII
jgi:peptidoglycan/LPS O-acetylase OafA/YrhL